MTLAAPKSRQGKFVLVLATLAVFAAVVGSLIWYSSASADLPLTQPAELDQVPDGPATVAPGSAASYTASATVTAALPVVTDELIIDLFAGAAQDGVNGVNFYLVSVSGVPAPSASGLNGFGDGYYCQWDDPVAAGAYSCTISGFVSGNLAVPFATICALPGDPTVCFPPPVPDGINILDNDGDMGTLTMSDPVTVDDATNFSGQSHTFVFTLAAGVTCESDGPPPSPPDDEIVQCVAGDISVGGAVGCTVTSGPTVTDGDIADDSFVSVTIDGGSGSAGTCTVSLDTYFVDGVEDDPTADFDIAIVTATKTFVTPVGELRHLDEADAATEDAAGNTDGILDPQDDSDDATGSFHQACIVNSPLTHAADSGDITWDIVAVAGSPLPTAVSITEVAGPSGQACVRWSTGFTGVQNITAVYDNGVGEAVTYYWDGYCTSLGGCSAGSVPLPLVKEWNTIDMTKIVAATGVVGDDLSLNTLDLADWDDRDCSFDPANAGFCDDANLDGLTLGVESNYILQSPQLFITAPPTSFIDYTIGSHDTDPGGSYNGPVDGAQQTYTITGDCGSVRLEDPQNGTSLVLNSGNPSETVLSSDKGVGFTFYPNPDGVATTQANANCGPNATICIGIDTEEDNLFRSPPIDDAADEEICVTYTVGPLVAKTPSLAWAGQRVVLWNDWSDVIECQENFYVLYSLQAGPGSFTAALEGNLLDVSQTGQDVIVEVLCDDPNSYVIFENQDQAQNDIIAYVVDGPDLSTATPLSQQVPFVIYYLKFEDAKLTLVPGAREFHNDGDFIPDDPFDSSDDVTDMTDVNVSADVLARLRVRGWVTTTNCPVRDSGTGANGEFLPANRCIFPDDWRFKAGGGVGDSLNDPATVAGFAEESRPNFDLDGDGIINAWDAPMTPALARFALTGSGFIHGADKDDIYTSTSNPFYSTSIPASPFIAPINADLSGYLWNTFGGPGGKSGPYDFWNDLADSGTEVLSCAGPSTDAHVFLPGGTDPCLTSLGSGVATGGYHMTKVYTDNHGEAMTWVNGDASLSFDECESSAGAAGHNIVLLSGYYCEEGDVVGDSTLGASVDYPDKRKHFAIESNDVTIEWTWGGNKEVSIVAGENAQFNYVVLTVTDRDGACLPFNDQPGSQQTLHPVLGEQVVFTIDSASGTIFPNVNGDPAAQLGTWTTKTADVVTFDAAANLLVADGGITVIDNDECQAWIHITESLLGPVNVIVTAYDPEGTVTFDVIVNEPTPVPTTPPPPATQQNLWADIDCNNDVNPVDSLKMLRADAGLSVSQDADCPAPSTDLNVQWDSQSTNEKWGDADCSGSLNPVDSLKVLRFDAGLFYIQQEPCPDIGAEVLIPQQ